MADDRYWSAAEAAAELGISVATLYAYASRGLLRSEPVPGEPRTRRYPREDVLRLQERKELRREPEKAAPKALSWGAPVLESAITLVEGGRLYYRGHDAVGLARSWTVEEVAALIWTGDRADSAELFQGAAASLPAAAARLLAAAPGLSPVERCQVALPIAGSADLASWDLRPRAVAATGARILRLLALVAAGLMAAGRKGKVSTGIAETLQAGWAPGRPELAGPISAALVLSADHELNVSAFTARCVASAAATPYDVVTAGLAALKGARHGGHTERVEALVREVGTASEARRTLSDRLRRGEPLPGFGHPFYPEGDPRGVALFEIAAAAAPSSSALDLGRAVAEAGWELIREKPTMDLGLATFARALELPAGSAIALFAMGRTIGWLGHAIEEYGLGRLIRPRASYTGEPAR